MFDDQNTASRVWNYKSRILCETEFVYSFLCTVNVNTNIQIRTILRFVVTKNSLNYVMVFKARIYKEV